MNLFTKTPMNHVDLSSKWQLILVNIFKKFLLACNAREDTDEAKLGTIEFSYSFFYHKLIWNWAVAFPSSSFWSWWECLELNPSYGFFLLELPFLLRYVPLRLIGYCPYPFLRLLSYVNNYNLHWKHRWMNCDPI